VCEQPYTIEAKSTLADGATYGGSVVKKRTGAKTKGFPGQMVPRSPSQRDPPSRNQATRRTLGLRPSAREACQHSWAPGNAHAVRRSPR